MLLLRWRKCSGTHTINVRVQRRQQCSSCLKDDTSSRLPTCHLPFAFVSDEDGISAVTTWIVGDYEKESGRKLLLNALNHLVGELFISSFFLLPAVLSHPESHVFQSSGGRSF